jgi:LPXTG-site transpeptidase (sortase) family protein
MILRKFIKYFIFIYLLNVVIINWNEVSWVFNYKAISRYSSSFFEKNIKPIQNVSAAENSVGESSVSFPDSNKENRIEIPALNLKVPLVVENNLDYWGVFKALDRGAVYYPESVLPGERGQTIILGHSAPPGWPKIKHDWIFSKIGELKEGDEIFVHFNGKKYVYSVKEKIIVKRGAKLPSLLTNSENSLVLISCWPPGKDLLRIAVMAGS